MNHDSVSFPALPSDQSPRRAGQTKRILQVFEPGVDGVFRHVEGLVEFLLNQEDWRVGIAYSSVRSSDGLLQLVDRVQAAGGPTLDLKIGNAPGLYDFQALHRLRSLMKSFRPDVVHAHSSKAGGLARLPFVLPKTPTFYTPHAYFGMGPRKGFKSHVFNVIERILAPHAITLHVSQEEADFAKDTLRLPNRFETPITNGVDVARFRPPKNLDEKHQAKQTFGIPSDAWVIGSIGRLSFQKDPESLTQAFAIFRKRFPDRPLRLLHACSGSPNEFTAIQSLASTLGIASDVVYPGYRKEPQAFFHAMDAFCLTSRYEGMPLTAIEAIASGLPLVLTDAPGLHCFGTPQFQLNQIYYGEKENAISIANAMAECLQHTEFENNHRLMAVKHFSNEQCHARIMAFYKASGGLKTT